MTMSPVRCVHCLYSTSLLAAAALYATLRTREAICRARRAAGASARGNPHYPLRKSDSIYSQWEMLESTGEAVPLHLLYTATFTPGSVRTLDLDPLTHSLTQPLEL